MERFILLLKITQQSPHKILTFNNAFYVIELDYNFTEKRMLIRNEKSSNDSITDSLFFLEKLTNISSQTKDEKGVIEVFKHVSSRLVDLGFNIQFLKSSINGKAPLLYALKPGKIDKKITFICHADTVTNIDRTPFKRDIKNNKIFGAGVADNKGGIITGLKAIESFLQSEDNHYHTLAFVVSPNEEIGSPGHHNTLSSIGVTSDYLIGLEPALYDGSIIHSRSGNRWYNVNVQGIAAHSGRFGEPHINAAHDLAIKISKFSQLANEQCGTRLNIGSFNGGNGSYNTVCSSASAKLDLRFKCFSLRDKLHNQIVEIISNSDQKCPYTDQKSKTFFSIEDDCPPLPFDNKNLESINQLKKIIEVEEKRKVLSNHSGGAADINYLSFPHNIGVDGMGPVGSGMHTTKEYILESSIFTRAQSIKNFLQVLNKKGD